MKIAYFCGSAELGGAERSLLDLINGLDQLKQEWFQCLVVAGDGPLVTQARKLGHQVAVLPFPKAIARVGDSGAGGPAGRQVNRLRMLRLLCAAVPAAAIYVLSLRRFIAASRPDVIHTNSLKMHILGIWASKGMPVIWHVRDYVGLRPLMAHLVSAHAARCATAVANSESVAGDLREVCGKRLPVSVVYNGIDLEQFSPCGTVLPLDALSKLPPAEPGAIRVGMLATMARWKGHEIFLRALSLLPTKRPVRGYIIGAPIYQTDGSQYTIEELRAIATRLGVADRVGFAGYVDNPAAAMRALEVVVHASVEPEPFGRVVAEAMACGRAVVASDAGGVREIATDGENALLHPCGAAAALAERIERLASDPELRARLGAAGRSNAELRFGRPRMAAEMIEVYRSVSAAASS